jgi:hypothetical protein
MRLVRVRLWSLLLLHACGQSGAGGLDAGPPVDAAVERSADEAHPDLPIPSPDSGACEIVGPLIERRELIPGSGYLEDIYASTVLFQGAYLMWYSGWRGPQHFPDDRVFSASSTNGLDWQSPESPALELAGAVADPSVVFQETQKRYLMVFSYIKDPAQWHGLSPENYALDGDESYLQLWIAESKDGVSWTGIKELIGRHNGHDNTGAWAPSILLQDANTAHVYYNNDPNFVVHPDQRYLILRSTVDLSGSPKLVSTTPVVSDGKLRANVDVSRLGSGYLMLYNEILASPVRRYRVAAMRSDDSVTWHEIDATPFRPAGTESLDIATPHLFRPPGHPEEIWIFVGEGDQNKLQSSVALWRYAVCP